MADYSIWVLEYSYVPNYHKSGVLYGAHNEGYVKLPYCYVVIKGRDHVAMVDVGYNDKDYGKTLFGQLVKNGDCMLFGTGLSKAELKDTLMIDGEGCKEYTIFAPTDDAFGDYCKKNGVTKLELMNLPEIPDVIKGHVVEGKYPMDQIPEEMTTLAGTTIKAPKVVMNKGRSKKKLANFNSTNGCYHMIDEVLA